MMHHFMTPDKIQKVNRTSTAGTAGANGTAIKWVIDNVPKTSKILDYGAGKWARHTVSLRQMGYDVTPYDIGENAECLKKLGYDVDSALDRDYDVVVAQAVVNVLPDHYTSMATIEEMFLHVRLGGTLVFNYPKEPRYNPCSEFDIMSKVKVGCLNVPVPVTKKRQLFVVDKPDVGKLVHRTLYVHKSVVPILPVKLRQRYITACLATDVYIYDVVKISLDREEVSFIRCNNFDGEHEPSIKYSVKVADSVPGTVKFYENNPPIYHGKGLMVVPGYKGFDRDEAVARYYSYCDNIPKKEKSLIGRQDYWNENKHRYFSEIAENSDLALY